MKRKFKAESKRLMDLMIHSIYTNKDIFLRELISNASDAMDKMYFESLTNDKLTFNKDDYFIEIIPNKQDRTITIIDSGIGMNEDELEENLGTIAQSGTLNFKEALSKEEKKSEIIGQFGVGFYSSFLVADRVEVTSKRFDQEKGAFWMSEGAEGYEIDASEKDVAGTEIKLFLKENTEDEDYDKYLEEYYLANLIKTYSNYIRYPIRMNMTKTREVEKDGKKEYEEYQEMETLNSMVPIWKKNKKDLTKEDYDNFYHDERFGFDEPLAHIHLNVEGMISYRAILYIPSEQPFNFRSKDFQRGLKLYSNGVLIMDKCEKLLPEAFAFVTGVVDSEDLSLNISREILQEDRQLRIIAKNIESKIKNELLKLMKDERERYEVFFKNFGTTLKAAIYESFASKKDELGDLLLFTSSNERKTTSLPEYIDRMKESQEKIYYATGETLDNIDRLPQGQALKEQGIEILYLTEPLDEFVIKVMRDFEGKEFSSISTETKAEEKEKDETTKGLLDKMKNILGTEVVEVIVTDHLGENPVCLLTRGDISIEMEKVLQLQGQDVKAEKVLQLNEKHPVYQKLKSVESDDEKLKLYTNLLYNQARLIEGLPIDNPTEYTKNLWKIME